MGALDWLKKTPIVSLLFAVALAAVTFVLSGDPDPKGSQFVEARSEARNYLVRNPRLDVDPLGELILDPAWLEQMRAAAAKAQPATAVQLPARMLARSQTRLDELIDVAYAARMRADPAWRYGVLDAQSPLQNYMAHVFVHENMVGVLLCIAVLLLAGAPLERTWGSPVFTIFMTAAIPVAAYGYRILDASSGIPWSGGAGLAAMLLGAYFIRGLGGHFMIPGLLLLPAWVATEAFLVRGFWLDDLGGVPWATLAASIGLGALVAGGLRLIGFESKRVGRSDKARSGPNPIVARAARLRSDGDPYQAFDLIQAAWRDHPGDAEVAEAFFSIAVEVDQPEAAAEAILPSLRFALKRGDVERAIEYWFPLASRQSDVRLDATSAVRLGEALLDAGHPEQALFSLRGALEVGVSSGHAVRIVNIARDLDPSLAKQASTIALNDPSLDPKTRAELESVARPQADANLAAPEPSAPPMPSRSQLDRRVQAEHQTVETTAFPLDALDSDFEQGEADPNEASLQDQLLDAGALSAESLGEDPLVSEDSGDVLSHWSDPGARSRDAIASAGPDLAEGPESVDLFGVDDLEAPSGSFDLAGGLGGADLFMHPADDETDTDLTPLVDATDELTSPIAPLAPEMSSPAVFDQPTEFVSATDPGGLPEAPESASSSASAAPTDEFAIGVGPGADRAEQGSIGTLRALKAIDAVPTEAGDDWLEIDVGDRGKSKLPLGRIQAIAMAAVAGLGPRPVLVVDFVLNWDAAPSEPMKSIRIRSDRFDPMCFSGAAENPLAALTTWIRRLQLTSGATCLPSRDLLDGRFARFEDLAAYERDVLAASPNP